MAVIFPFRISCHLESFNNREDLEGSVELEPRRHGEERYGEAVHDFEIAFKETPRFEGVLVRRS